MGVRERKIETALNVAVTAIGGLTRKWVSPGRPGVPDRIVIYRGRVIFAEIKTEDGRLSGAQEREHQRLRAAGAQVVTVYGHAGVQEFMEALDET